MLLPRVKSKPVINLAAPLISFFLPPPNTLVAVNLLSDPPQKIRIDGVIVLWGRERPVEGPLTSQERRGHSAQLGQGV